MAIVFLTWVQYGLYPVWMVGRIRILLAFQTNAHVLGVGETVLARDLGIRTYTLEVAAIYLNTWLVGKHLHKDTSLWRVKTCTNLCVVTLTVLKSIQTEIVIVTCSILNLVKF